MNRKFLALSAAMALVTGLAVGPALSQQAAPPASSPSTIGSASASGGQTLDSVIALVNGDLISAWDVRNRMRMLLMTYGGQGQPSKEVMAQVQYEAIESLIDEKIKLQEFNELSKSQKISKEEIDEEIADLARQNRMTSDQFTKNFEESGANISTLREQIESSIAWRALISGRYGKTIRVSEMRVNEMLDRIKDSLDKPQYRLAEIFLYAPDQASMANAKTRATQIVDRINQGADFKAVARQFSAAPSASQGGDMGWMSQGDMRPEIESAVAKAPAPPAVLPPIESEGGVYIIALTGKRDPSQAPPATLDLMQVTAAGSDAAAKLQLVKGKAKDCKEVEGAAKEVGGVTSTPMSDISLGQIAAGFRNALEPLDAGSSTAILDLEGDNKMVFYVCAKRAGANELPSREEIKDRLFQGEITMISERYLRDLKREATIERK
jgi:peptidyl-prolyl cis-trans isomerase SurA